MHFTLLDSTYVCETVDDAKIIYFVARGVIIMRCLKSSIITSKCEIPFGCVLFHLIGHTTAE